MYISKTVCYITYIPRIPSPLIYTSQSALDNLGAWRRCFENEAYRRLCEVKGSGRMWCDQKTRDDFVAGGERRQWLELALLESLKRHGSHRGAYDKVKAWWLKNVGVYRCSKFKPINLIHSKLQTSLWNFVFSSVSQMPKYNQNQRF